MAQDIQVFDVTVAPGNNAAAPARTTFALTARVVTGIEVIIPDGVRGVVHFALSAAGTNIIPSNAGGYITGNNEKLAWQLRGFHDSGAWQFAAYNTGNFAHVLQVRFLLDLPQQQALGLSVPIPAMQLSG